MNSTRIITYIRENILADALLDENGRLTEISLTSRIKEPILDNIYVGRVQRIAKNIQAAFVEIAKDTVCYLPLEELKNPAVYVRQAREDQLTEGDELLVQVSREAVKTKGPSVTTNLHINGKYLIVTSGNRHIGCSVKLKTADRERLKKLADTLKPGDVGLIVRTNAAEASDEELASEYSRLHERLQKLCTEAVHRTVYSCVYKSRPSYLTSLLNSRNGELQEIVTDDRELYAQIRDFLREEMPQELGKLRMYEERLQPLKALYRLEKGLSDALMSRVWLKTGAYLVIEPTEALTVIDVNSGKYTKGKDKQAAILKVNREAAAEIARQLRLRNLSGIILVDFVDMEDEDARTGLLAYMRELLKKDPLKADAVDITKLGLMELTRRKQKKTLAEQAKECGL